MANVLRFVLGVLLMAMGVAGILLCREWVVYEPELPMGVIGIGGGSTNSTKPGEAIREESPKNQGDASIKTKEAEVCGVLPLQPVKVMIGARNKQDEVKQVEEFLNYFEDADLVVNGVYEGADIAAVKVFQEKYRDELIGLNSRAIASGQVTGKTAEKMQTLSVAECNRN